MTETVTLPVRARTLGLTPVERGHAAQDSERDFVEYVEARQQALVRFAYLLTSDHHTAEDLVQTALAKTYLTWNRLRDRGAVDAYVRRIIVNENSSLWRRAWKRNERATDALPENSQAPSRDSADRDVMWQVVQRLPAKQRAAVVLRYYEQLSEAETAAVLGRSVGNVKSQTSRGIASIRVAVTVTRTPGWSTVTGHDPFDGGVEHDLRTALARHAQDVQTVDLASGAVRRAGRIRTRRRLTSGLVTLAAVAIAVPVGLQLTDQPPSANSATSHPTTDSAAAAVVEVQLAGLASGPAPAVPYVDGSTYHANETSYTLTTAPHRRVVDAIAFKQGPAVFTQDLDVGADDVLRERAEEHLPADRRRHQHRGVRQ